MNLNKKNIPNALIGHIVSNETRRKISEAQLGSKNHMYGKRGTNFGKLFNKTIRLKMSKSHKGIPLSNIHKKNISKALIGRIVSEKTKLKLSKANKGKNNPMYGRRGKDSPRYGSKQTKECKKLISISKMGHKYNLGRICSLKTRMKISKANKGHKLTKEQEQKRMIGLSKNPTFRKNNKIERMVQEELRVRKIKFKTHIPLIGQPDIFINPNICIFIDGDLYHANPYKYKPNTIVPKINMKAKDKWNYDKSVNRRLRYRGYKVLRFWEKDIHKDINLVINKIKKVI
jgi:DNA mismatch endonuclease (patch repair protein)